MAIKQISSCPSLAPRFHAPPPPAPSYHQTRKVAGTRRAQKQTEALQCFFLKAGYCSTEPVSCLGICFPPHATPVINWLCDCFIGMLLWLLWNKLNPCSSCFFFFFFFFMQEKEKKKKKVLFPELQRGVASRNLCHRDMLRECLMSSFKCQPAHKRSRVVICFKDFKS